MNDICKYVEWQYVIANSIPMKFLKNLYDYLKTCASHAVESVLSQCQFDTSGKQSIL